MSEWFENDVLWADICGVLFNQQRMEQAPDEVEQLIRLVGPPENAAILDLGCGQGRHAIEFAKRGYRVTGVDRTAQYLAGARARARAEQCGVSAEWVESDMRAFRRDGAFDLAVNLLSSFGYFEDPKDDLRILENVRASLKPGGRLVIDLMGKEVLTRQFRPRDWHEEPDGTILLEEREVTDGWQRLAIRWIVLKGNERREHRFTLRSFSAGELLALHTDAGFADCRVYGTYSGKPYDHEAERLIIVAARAPA